jgi:hypothetical protein
VSVLVTAANDRLAALALDAARAAGRGPGRAPALCAAVALAESKTIAGARKILDALDTLGRPDLKAAAADLIDQLARRAALQLAGQPATERTST